MTIKNKAIFATLCAATACAQNHEPITEENMPNPVVVFCEHHHGKVVLRQAEDGSTYHVCILPDGKEVDEWTIKNGSVGHLY